MFKVFGIDIMWIIPLGLTYVTATLFIGYIDYKKGIWLAENDYYFYELSPYRKRQYDRIQKIYDHINKEEFDDMFDNVFNDSDEIDHVWKDKNLDDNMESLGDKFSKIH